MEKKVLYKNPVAVKYTHRQMKTDRWQMLEAAKC